MGVRSLFPILNSRDLPRLVSFYEDALGATVEYRFATGDEDDYVSLRLGTEALGIGRVPDAPTEGDRVALWFYVDDVDAAFAAWTRLGGATVQAPADMPWGERVAQVRDPDGNLVNLGAQPVSPA
ncbi:VOC family protein [Microbacterium sp.]|uniref:VOC family protein n=1 Tax=Microbacterium sp. TaxID=51671 RepID=UPI002E375137|nr:VOC family protein [Microbacterium sp.]HEX5730307.1 VOC family protein [Microbacterium sp.]